MFLRSLHQQKILKLISKGFETLVYWNRYKTKRENKNMRNEDRYFLESNFVGVNRLFVLVYSNQDDNAKRFKTRRYYIPKGIIRISNIIIKSNSTNRIFWTIKKCRWYNC